MIAETPKQLSESLDKAVACLLNGLNTDGAHHKQYEMEAALRLICGDKWTDQAQAEFQWEDGIPG